MPTQVRRPSRVGVHGHREVGADRPEGLVARVVIGGRQVADSDGAAGQQDSAEDAVLAQPANFLDGDIDVVDGNEPDAGALAGCLGAEVGQPAVVGVNSRLPQRRLLLVLVGRDSDIEWQVAGLSVLRSRTAGKDHLGDDAVRSQLAGPPLGVPDAIHRAAVDAHVPSEFLLRLLVEERLSQSAGAPIGQLRAPAVEGLAPRRVHVLAYVVEPRGSVTIRRNHQVAICRRHSPASPMPPTTSARSWTM